MMDEIIRRMEAAAQVQPQPRKDGQPVTARWLGTLCSNCMRPEQRPDQHPYCPNCGAKMLPQGVRG